MANLEVALRWAQHNWKIFPAYWNGEAHVGYVKWGAESSDDPATIEQWFYKWPDAHPCVNLGQSGLSVLDVDDKDGKSGGDTLFALDLQGLSLPADTPTSKTPSGSGVHYWFKGPLKNSAGKLGPGLDTRGHGGMVPCPGAHVKGKGDYVWCGNGKLELGYVPTWIVDRVGLPNPRKEERGERTGAEDTDANFITALAWLREHAPMPVPGERNDAAYRVAAKLRDFGLSEGSAYALAEHGWNSLLESPLPPDELRSVFSHAEEYAQNAGGTETAEAAGFTKVEEEHSVVSISDLVDREAPEREWVIKRWVPLGSASPTLVTGDGGTGKSTLMMQLAVAAATGTPWLGEEVHTQMPSLCIVCEDDINEIHRRVRDIRNGYGEEWVDPKGQIFFLPQVGRNSVMCLVRNGALVDGPFYDQLDRHMLSLPWHGQQFLLFLDTVADIHGANENDRAAITQLIKNKICGLCHKHNATPILIAHPPKSKETFSGSTAWNNSVRNRLYLSYYNPETKDGLRLLTREKANYAAAGERKILKYDRGVYRVIGEVEILDAVAECVFSAISNAATKGVPLQRSPNAARYICRCGILDHGGKALPKSMITAALNKLTADGRIEERAGLRNKNGFYPTEGEG